MNHRSRALNSQLPHAQGSRAIFSYCRESMCSGKSYLQCSGQCLGVAHIPGSDQGSNPNGALPCEVLQSSAQRRIQGEFPGRCYSYRRAASITRVPRECRLRSTETFFTFVFSCSLQLNLFIVVSVRLPSSASGARKKRKPFRRGDARPNGRDFISTGQRFFCGTSTEKSCYCSPLQLLDGFRSDLQLMSSRSRTESS